MKMSCMRDSENVSHKYFALILYIPDVVCVKFALVDVILCEMCAFLCACLLDDVHVALPSNYSTHDHHSLCVDLLTCVLTGEVIWRNSVAVGVVSWFQ